MFLKILNAFNKPSSIIYLHPYFKKSYLHLCRLAWYEQARSNYLRNDPIATREGGTVNSLVDTLSNWNGIAQASKFKVSRD